MNAEQRQARALELLEQVGIPNPARVGRQYPHELQAVETTCHHRNRNRLQTSNRHCR